jgi:NhaA family Na+:H+ antiporter
VTPVSPYLSRYATALLLGAGAATLAVSIAPSTYYDLVEWHPHRSAFLSGLRLFHPGLTFTTLVSSFFMGFFLLLLGKELWEAIVLERGGLHGRRALGPLAWVIGGIAGGIAVWLLMSGLIETAEEAGDAPGWILPATGGLVVSFLFGRMIFGPSHPALQVLLFVTLIEAILGLLATGLLAPIGGNLRLLWLAVPIAAALFGYYGITRPLHPKNVSEVARRRAQALWPWLSLGLLSWIGVSAAGLPPVLGFLPILPAMPHGNRSFGLFAAAESLLNDPLNRLERLMMPPVILVLFCFGLTRGGIDFAAINPTTWVTVVVFCIGKPLGVLTVALLVRGMGFAQPQGVDFRATVLLAGLMGIGFTLPLATLETALPGGAMQEAARLGLGLSVLAGPLLLVLSRYWKA